MPNQPKTPGRHVRIDDERWSALLDLARAEGTTASEMIRDMIDERLRRK